MGEEDGGQSKGVDHGDEATPLPGATETCSIVEHSVGESLSFSSHHVTQLVHSEVCITGVLTDVDSACLECTPPHLSVEGKKPEAGVLGKSTIFIHHHVLEVVTNGDLVATLAEEVSSSSGKQGGEGHAEIPLSRKLIDRSPANCGPQECVD